MIPIQVLLTIEKFLAKEKKEEKYIEINGFLCNGFAITCKQLGNDSTSATRGHLKKQTRKTFNSWVYLGFGSFVPPQFERVVLL